ncbi:hypothetical protein BDR07DRAFT_1478427 [Suillus spraguei]|nr:hypothetical protein BDR07DRAFT_1478427 [Suillus spraguei]
MSRLPPPIISGMYDIAFEYILSVFAQPNTINSPISRRMTSSPPRYPTSEHLFQSFKDNHWSSTFLAPFHVSELILSEGFRVISVISLHTRPSIRRLDRRGTSSPVSGVIDISREQGRHLASLALDSSTCNSTNTTSHCSTSSHTSNCFFPLNASSTNGMHFHLGETNDSSFNDSSIFPAAFFIAALKCFHSQRGDARNGSNRHPRFPLLCDFRLLPHQHFLHSALDNSQWATPTHYSSKPVASKTLELCTGLRRVTVHEAISIYKLCRRMHNEPIICKMVGHVPTLELLSPDVQSDAQPKTYG